MNDKFLTEFLDGLKSENSNQITIQITKGYEIDSEKSAFDENELCIKLKKKEVKFRGSNALIEGFYINNASDIISTTGSEGTSSDLNLFYNKKQAVSALAMARISQIMANDERFGGVITDKEWEKEQRKYTIERIANQLEVRSCYRVYYFLTFHTEEQAILFLEENRDLVKQYLMID